MEKYYSDGDVLKGKVNVAADDVTYTLFLDR